MRKPVLALFIALLAAVAAAVVWWQRDAERVPALSGPPPGGDFTLTSAHGPVSLHDFRGKWVLLYFGYTYCPDICPTNLGNLAVAWRQLPPEAQKQVQILFVSVDPKRDTPERLQQYVDYFGANIIGLTGPKAVIDEITQRYGVVYRMVPVKDSAMEYLVDHSAFTYLIDPQGRLITQLPHGTTPAQFKQVIQQHLEEK